MKKVSVIVTCYNKGKYILETLESVKCQTFTDFEMIVVDDCSDDIYTKNILTEIIKSGIEVILLKNNMGVSEARNIGIRKTNGSYIIVLDGDDKISKTYLEEAVKILESDNDIKIATCEVELFGYMKGKMPLSEPEIEYLIAQNALVVSSLFRREDYNQTIGFNSNMKEGLEDWDFWLSILEKGGKVYRIPKVHFYYRISKKSRNNLDFEKLRSLRKQIYNNHKELYAKYLLDPVNSFEYTMIKNSKEYKLGYLFLKPIRVILKKLGL